MAIYSPEADALDTLASGSGDLFRAERFDPFLITSLDTEAGPEPLYFKSALALRASTMIVARFTQDPGATRASRTKDVVYHGCDFGVLLRDINDEEEAERATRLALSRDLDPRYVRVAEMLVRIPGSEESLATTGTTKVYVPTC